MGVIEDFLNEEQNKQIKQKASKLYDRYMNTNWYDAELAIGTLNSDIELRAAVLGIGTKIMLLLHKYDQLKNPLGDDPFNDKTDKTKPTAKTSIKSKSDMNQVMSVIIASNILLYLDSKDKSNG